MISSNIKLPNPKRGEVWLVDLDPTKGSEIQKRRPIIVLSSDTLRRLPIRVAVPVTGWKNAFETSYAHVLISPTTANGLTKESAADTLQVRAVALERFIKKMGVISASKVEEVAAAIAAVVEYQ